LDSDPSVITDESSVTVGRRGPAKAQLDERLVDHDRGCGMPSARSTSRRSRSPTSMPSDCWKVRIRKAARGD